MVHGAGGAATRELIERLFLPQLRNPALASLSDAGVFEHAGGRLALTADSFVVRPLRFAGGSIGELAVHGTLNDLAVSGAQPLALTAAFILEAGLPLETLAQEIAAAAEAARTAGVPIVNGDTKVVERGKADGLYICTSGIGMVIEQARLGAEFVRPGDRVLLSGPIGDHGVTILIARAELNLEAAELRSDTRNVWPLIRPLLMRGGAQVRWLRDATRGGVATVLNELARDAQVGVRLADEALPVRPVVRGACELLGLDPLHVANEGQFVAVVDQDFAAEALAVLRAAFGGLEACEVGEVVAGPAGQVWSVTPYGGSRAVDMLVGDPLPRIC